MTSEQLPICQALRSANDRLSHEAADTISGLYEVLESAPEPVKFEQNREGLLMFVRAYKEWVPKVYTTLAKARGQADQNKCDFCESPAITELDGDTLCKSCADMWVAAEEEDRLREQEDDGQFGVGA